VSGAAQIRTFGISASEVTAIDEWIEQIAARWSTNDRVAFNARLCVAELAANVLEHGRASADEKDHIVITLRQVMDGLEIEFRDSLGPFDSAVKAKGPKPAPSEAGGLGLMLIQSYAKDLSYANDGNYNRVRFKIASA
jgi:anti-sigma regulatory factor (Ser/Thr protein kinase)